MGLRGTGAAWRWVLLPWREPVFLAAMIAAAALPALLLSSGDVWEEVARDAVTAAVVEAASPADNGIDITVEGPLDESRLDEADAQVGAALLAIDPQIDIPDPAVYTATELVEIAPGTRGVGPALRLVAGDGLLDGLTVMEQLDDTSGGVWASATFVARHDLQLGDGVAFQASGLEPEVWAAFERGETTPIRRIVAIYAPLWSSDPALEPPEVVSSLPPELVPRYSSILRGPGHDLLFTDRETMLDGRLVGFSRWRAPLESLPPDHSGLLSLARRVRLLERDLVGTGDLGQAMVAITGVSSAPPRLVTELFETEAEARASVARLGPPIATARGVGVALSLLALLAAAVLYVDVRRRELRLLVSEGVGPAGLGLRVAGQLAVPFVVAGLAGTVAAVLGVWLVGPADGVEVTPLRPLLIAGATLLALIIVMVVAAGLGWRVLRPSTAAVRAAALTALAIGLGLSVAAVWVQSGAGTDVDLVAVLLPVLVVTAAVVFAGVVIIATVRQLSGPTRGLPIVLLLTLRRLGRLGGGGPVFLAVGLGAGLLVFSVTLDATVTAALSTKLSTEVGARTNVGILDPIPEAAEIPGPWTIVDRLDTRIVPGQDSARVVVVDAATAPEVLDWPVDAEMTIDNALALLADTGGDAVPALRLRGQAPPATGAFGVSIAYPYQLVGDLSSFPLASGNRSSLLIRRDALEASILRRSGFATRAEADAAGVRFELVGGRQRLLSTASLQEVVAAAEGLRLRAVDGISVEMLGQAPRAIGSRFGLGFMAVLGVVSTLVGIAALGLHLAARRRKNALTRLMTTTMGLSPGRAALVTTLEVRVLTSLAAGAAIAAVPAVVTRLAPRFDPLPGVPPQVATLAPWGLLAAWGILSVAGLVLVVWLTEHGTKRHGAGPGLHVGEPILRCEHLVRHYDTPTGRVQAVRGVDLAIPPGRTAAIVGPSGSGKSSLLRMLAGLDRPTAGTVQIAGTDLWALSERARSRARASLLTHVRQRPEDNLYGHLTVAMHLRRRGRAGDGAADEVAMWLTALGLAHWRDTDARFLSGGEQQRLAFARAAVAGHRVVIADEPTSQLDTDSAEAVMAGVARLAADGITVLIATHDQRVLARVDLIIALRDGAVATVSEGGTAVSVIDASGRLQLPPELRSRFAGGVRLRWDDDTDDVRLERP